MTTNVLDRIVRLGLLLLACLSSVQAGSPPAGPAFQRFEHTLSPGERTEVAGPLYYQQRAETVRTWAAPPLVSYTLDSFTDFEEIDVLYPLLSYDRFGSAYRFHIMQLFSFAGGASFTETNIHRFTLFPIYFQQRSVDNPELNYTAVLPFYGTIGNRLFRDEIQFVMWPAYVKSRKRDVVTKNYMYPFVHVRRGDGLRGWQFWPFFGRELKGVTVRTNMWEETEVIGGHIKMFALWPIYFDDRTFLGTPNYTQNRALLPLYSWTRSPARETWTIPWPLGLTKTVDRELGYREWGAPWPLIVFAHGPGKTARRVWPFFSRARNETQRSDFYLWPVFYMRRIEAAPLPSRDTRIVFFLSQDLKEVNQDTGKELDRREFWPFYTYRKDFEGRTRLQALALLEPLLRGKSIERNWSPLWSVWRAESNPTTGRSSQSLLWNLYRRETGPESRKCSLLFGLFQYQSGAAGRHWRIFYLPFKRSTGSAEEEPQ